MNEENLAQIIEVVHRFVQQSYPNASLVLLCGSWARRCAHQDSAIALFIREPALLDQVRRNHYRWSAKLIGQWEKALTKRKAS
jgi:hypothetical protein